MKKEFWDNVTDERKQNKGHPRILIPYQKHNVLCQTAICQKQNTNFTIRF